MSSEPKYKLLFFFKRNPNLSATEFKAYYEANHVPMVMELGKKATGLLRYTRRYLDHEASEPALDNPFTVFGVPAPLMDFDIVNEVTFRSKAEAKEFARLMYEENAEKVVADENKLFIRNKMRGVLIEEEIVSIQ